MFNGATITDDDYFSQSPCPNIKTNAVACVIVNHNDGDGILMEEKDAGNFFAAIMISAINNSTRFGIKATQGEDGMGPLRLTNVDLSNNGDGELDLLGVIGAK